MLNHDQTMTAKEAYYRTDIWQLFAEGEADIVLPDGTRLFRPIDLVMQMNGEGSVVFDSQNSTQIVDMNTLLTVQVRNAQP